MFRIGMKVVCIKKGRWLVEELNEFDDMGPKFNEVVTICGIDATEGVYLRLAEYRNDGLYNSIMFRPVQDQYTEEEIEAVNIDEILEPVRVEV